MNPIPNVAEMIANCAGDKDMNGTNSISKKLTHSDGTHATVASARDRSLVSHPHLCFVGYIAGRNPGRVPHQSEILAKLFKEAGYPVAAVSDELSRWKRLTDIVSTLIRRRHNSEIIMLQVFGEMSFIGEDIASSLAKRFRQPLVMVLRGGTLPEFMGRFPHWTTGVLRRADVLVTPSSYLPRVLASYGLRSRVIPNVVNLPLYPYRHRQTVQPRLFWMRTFHPHYNPLMAIRVLARLRASRPTATLVMAGADDDAALQREVRQTVEACGLKDAVNFPGFLDMKGKSREGTAADIFLNTNQVDNMPVSVLEACAMGIPVVATKVGGIGDLLVDGETALLVPSDDDEAMVKAIGRLLNEPGLAARLSANGRRLAESCSWKQVRGCWEELFSELLSRRAR